MQSQTRSAERTKKMVMLAVLAAIAYAVYFFFGRIPILPAAPFLTYDPKDVIIAIGGLIYGPFSAFLISLVVSLVEMFTTSVTGPIGLVMNMLASCAFACTAAFIYKKRQSMKSAVVGLLAGVGMTVAVMLLWNYFITPLYMGISRDAVAAMLIPVFLPFNLLKSAINAAITMLLYKPLVKAMRMANLIPPSRSSGVPATKGSKIFTVGAMLVSFLVLASCVMLILVLQGVI